MKRRTFLRSALAGTALMASPLVFPGRGTAATAPAASGGPKRSIPGPRRSSSAFPDVEAVTGDGRGLVIRGADLAELDRALRGRLLLAGDDGYDDARRILNPSFDRHPALVVQATGVADVQHAVDFARDQGGVLLAVKCGGHSASGQSTCDRGIVLDLSPFRSARVDVGARRAQVAGGSLLGLVDHETLAQGFTTPLGTVSHTGVGGLVTGGGFGRLARRFGLSIDNLVSVDVVTADGRLVHAHAGENPELFWGVRGGGGNFGVVTAFEFELHPFDRRVVAGDIIWPIERARDVLSVFGEYGPVAPDELQLDPYMVYPPGGAPGIAGFQVCWSGPESGAEAALAPLRRLGTPLSDSIERADYQDVQRSGDISDPRARGEYLKGGFINRMDSRLIDAALDGFEPDPARSTVLFVQHGGGAISRVAPEATAFPQRDVLGNLICLTGWSHGEDPSVHMAWGRAFWRGIESHTTGFYVNDLEIEHTASDIRDNYRQNAARLVALKNRHDPRNLFRMNANIVPTVPADAPGSAAKSVGEVDPAGPLSAGAAARRPGLAATLLAAAVLGVAAPSASAQVPVTDRVATATATAFLEEDLAEARAAGAFTEVHAVHVDLDEDGTPEIVGALHSAFHCGGQGPCLFVLRRRAESGAGGGAGWEQVFRVPGVWMIELAESSTAGWRDLVLNGEVSWRWNGRSYGPEG
jgi:FAD/FMN-containing dehydrogenase